MDGFYNGNVDAMLKLQCQIHNAFSKLVLRRCINVASALRRTWNKDYLWSRGSISTTFPQSREKV